ncbi:MAG: hypothetical protein ACKOWO_08435 [Sediminibacterium sp.]
MDQKSIIQLHKDCSVALKKLNDKLQESKVIYDIPTIKLVNIPSGYIRPVLSFANSYRLKNVIDNEKLVKNIYYSLQYLEYLKYINNTFAIILGIRTLFFKYSIIHIYSIYEGILSGVNENLRNGCEECKKHATCPYFLPKLNYKTHEKIVELVEKKLELSAEFLLILKKFKKSRDLVHIHTIAQSEHENNEYELLLKEGYRGLNILKKDLVPKVSVYKTNRKCRCFN